jgi:hypothetical protein
MLLVLALSCTPEPQGCSVSALDGEGPHLEFETVGCVDATVELVTHSTAQGAPVETVTRSLPLSPEGQVLPVWRPMTVPTSACQDAYGTTAQVTVTARDAQGRETVWSDAVPFADYAPGLDRMSAPGIHLDVAEHTVVGPLLAMVEEAGEGAAHLVLTTPVCGTVLATFGPFEGELDNANMPADMPSPALFQGSDGRLKLMVTTEGWPFNEAVDLRVLDAVTAEVLTQGTLEHPVHHNLSVVEAWTQDGADWMRVITSTWAYRDSSADATAGFVSYPVEVTLRDGVVDQVVDLDDPAELYPSKQAANVTYNNFVSRQGHIYLDNERLGSLPPPDQNASAVCVRGAVDACFTNPRWSAYVGAGVVEVDALPGGLVPFQFPHALEVHALADGRTALTYTDLRTVEARPDEPELLIALDISDPTAPELMWVFQVPDNVSPADRRQGGMSTLQVNDAPAVCTYSSTSNEQFCVDVGSGHLVHGLVQPEPGTGRGKWLTPAHTLDPDDPVQIVVTGSL